MHNNVPALWWESRKRREQDKEAEVSQARQRCRFLSSLSNSKHPTLLTPLAAPGGQTKRRLVCQKVTKINKSETPPPTTWPKARGSHARCCSSFPSQVFPSYASPSRARRRRPEEHRGSSHSARRGLAALLRCWGRKGKEATERLATITATARFKVLKVVCKVEIRVDFHLWW